MEWIDAISEAVGYIEENITEELPIDKIAMHVNISPFYFQKGFSLLCGFTVSEYIRKRRLTLAGTDIACTNQRVLDVALKYGYDSADSFTKAFTRFHGETPYNVRKNAAVLKSFAPLKIKFSLEGGYLMEYKVVQKDSFTVIGSQKTFSYETGKIECPKFWDEHYASGKGKTVCGMYGISIDEKMNGETFEYLIADNYNPKQDVPEGFVTRVIPAFTWAVFPCRGAMPNAMQSVNTKFFSEWLPANKQYEVAAGYCVEMYDDMSKYPKGIKDENYYSEMWFPVKTKD